MTGQRGTPPAQPLAQAPHHYKAFRRLVAESSGKSSLRSVVAYGLYMETEGRWIDNLDGKSPTIDQQRNYHDFGCTDHSIKKVTDEADRLLEEFGDDLVRSHVEKYLKEAIENAVNASHRTTRKSFFVGAAEAFVGALFWTLTLFLASILAERVGIDLLETYKRVSGHS